MSSEWPLVAVEDVCELIVDCVNKTAPVLSEPTPFRMIRTTNVRNGRIDLSDCRYVDQATYEKWTRRAKLQTGDVILTREAPIGEVGLVKESDGIFLGQRLMQYRADPRILDSRFLLYSFLSPALQHQFGSHEGSGSVVSHIRVGDCFKFKLRLPPLEVQREFAALLGSLDDRIALLRETSATLEAIAQALFKSWFVDFDPVRAKMEGKVPKGMDDETVALFPCNFEESSLGLIPKGWKAESISAVASLRGGKQLDRSEFDAEAINPIFGGAGEMGRTALSNADGFVITVGRVGAYCGQFFWHNGPAWVNNNASLVRPKIPQDSHWLHQALLSSNIDRIKKGAAQPFVSNSDIEALPLVLPDSSTRLAFKQYAEPLYQRQSAKSAHAHTLEELRNTLLPRLISGQLRLPQAQEEVEEALA